MALQPAPPQLRQILGDAYKWLVQLLRSLTTVQTQANTLLTVSGLTIQNNTPSGGKISWSASTVFYQNVAYLIAAGSTPNSELFVTWTVGATSFTVGNSFTPGPTVFPILTNNQGTADVTWNKVGAAAVQASNLFPVLTYDGPNGSLIISNVVFSDNSPGAGSVAWTACQATYKGVTYQVAAGSTGAGSASIVWKLASPTLFQTAGDVTTIALGPDDFLIGQNLGSDITGNSGFFSRIQSFSNHLGCRFFASENGFAAINSGNFITFSLIREGFNPADGIFSVGDGLGNNTIQLRGNQGTAGTPCGVIKQKPVTFAQLPTAQAGDRAVISDGPNTPTFGAAASGGGSKVVPVSGTSLGGWVFG